MKREIPRLAAAAARVESDLRRTTGQAWLCSVADDYTLRVSIGAVDERLLLDDEVEDSEWFVPAHATDSQVEDGLDADADELLANEVAEALDALGVTWPTCPEHGRVLGACSGWWFCGGEPHHDVAVIGSLRSDAAAVVPPS